MRIPQSVLDDLDRTPDKVNHAWSPWELEVLRIYGRVKGLSAMARILKRSYSSVKNKHEYLLANEVNKE